MFLLGELILPKETISDTRCEAFDVPWKMIRRDGTTTEITIPGVYPADRNEIVTVETVLPEDIKENLEKIRSKEYHIIFLEHMMPQMDGLETFRAMKQLKEVFDFLDTKTGLMYCGDSEEFYLEMLKTTLENDRTSPIRESYAQQDWKQYGICMHSLKSTSLSIGADKLSEHAKTLEMAAKEGRTDYVHQEHDSLLNEYQELLQKIEKGLASL